MNALFLVMKNELVTKFTSKSYLFATFGLPIVSFLLFLVVAMIQLYSASLLREVTSNDSGALTGYVDASGLINPAISESDLIAYPDEASARQALEADVLKGFYLIADDFMESAEVTYIQSDFNPLSALWEYSNISRLLRINLLEGDIELARRYASPLYQQQKTSLAPKEPSEAIADDSSIESPEEPESASDEDNEEQVLLLFAMSGLFYFMIFGTASHNLSRVIVEKENRVMEILLTSLKPQQILGGKLIGIALTGLFQVAVWLGYMYLLTYLGGSSSFLLANIALNSSTIGWAIIFFALGYLLYASLLAGLGALVPNLREASLAAFIINSPLLLALIVLTSIIDDPNGSIATAFSLFPLTAPILMMARIILSPEVPPWQILLSIALLILTLLFIIRTVTQLFRAQILLSGQAFGLKHFFSALLGRV